MSHNVSMVLQSGLTRSIIVNFPQRSVVACSTWISCCRRRTLQTSPQMCVCKLLMPLGQYGIYGNTHIMLKSVAGRWRQTQFLYWHVPQIAYSFNSWKLPCHTRLLRPPKSVLPFLIYIIFMLTKLCSAIHLALTDRQNPSSSILKIT